MINFLRALLVPAVLTFILSGCGNSGVSELQVWMADVKKSTRIDVPKLSEPKVYIPVAYTGKADIDPFNAAKLLAVFAKLRAESNNGLAPDRNRAKEALEAFPLDVLKMVGIIENKGVRQALIQVDKTIYQAKLGDHLGQDDGKIMRISETEIAIKEKVQDSVGEWTERDSKLELQEVKK